MLSQENDLNTTLTGSSLLTRDCKQGFASSQCSREKNPKTKTPRKQCKSQQLISDFNMQDRFQLGRTTGRKRSRTLYRAIALFSTLLGLIHNQGLLAYDYFMPKKYLLGVLLHFRHESWFWGSISQQCHSEWYLDPKLELLYKYNQAKKMDHWVRRAQGLPSNPVALGFLRRVNKESYYLTVWEMARFWLVFLGDST